MLTNRVRKRKRGYERKKGYIEVAYQTSQVMELLELRAEEGYILGWTQTIVGGNQTQTKAKPGLKVYLRYTPDGSPSRSQIKRMWKPSRKRAVDAQQLWGVNGEMGRYLLQTSKGRRTSVEARKKKVGGMVWRWVM